MVSDKEIRRSKIAKWLPVALCCLPGVAAAAIVGVGIAVGGSAFGASFGGPLGLGLVALALLACPLSMGLMVMRRGSNRNSASGRSQMMADCCLPGEANTSPEAGSSAERLASLRAQREALERELAEMQTQ